MATEFLTYDQKDPYKYLQGLNAATFDETLESTVLYYQPIFDMLKSTLIDIHYSECGGSCPTDSDNIILSVKPATEEIFNEGINWTNFGYHIELFNNETKNLVRILPSPLRDGMAIVTMYSNASDNDDRITKFTERRCELASPLIHLMRIDKLASKMYKFLNDSNGDYSDMTTIIEKNIPVLNYH